MTNPGTAERTARAPWRGQPIVLASASPRRRALLAEAGVPHAVVPAEIDERAREGESPRQLTRRLARAKATAVAAKLADRHTGLVLGSDTIVVEAGVVFGKPRDAEDAVRILGRLVGRTHSVFTAVAVVDAARSRVWECSVESRVTMRDAEESELRRYVATGEPLDKAGAYAIQGLGADLVVSLSGSRSNVIGLPIDETLALLARAEEERGATAPDAP